MKLFLGMECSDCSGPDSFPLLGWAELRCCQEDTECRVQTQLSTLTEDQEKTVYLTVDEMREFLRKLSRNNNFAAGREFKWGV